MPEKRKRHRCFFDNVYIYGKGDGVMTETTPYNPCSRKEEIRAKVSEILCFFCSTKKVY